MTAFSSSRPQRATRLLFLTLFGLIWIGLPFWFLLVNSFKTEGEANLLSLAWPTHWNAGNNFSTVIGEGHYFRGLFNSALIAIPTIVAVLLFGSMAAWIYARSKSRTLKFVYLASILSILLPPAIIPTIYVLMELGLDGSRIGYMITLAGTRLGIVIFLTTGFIRSIPPDIEQAAFVDGASRFGVYRHIVLRMITPVLFVGAVMLAISIWNDFFMALYLLPEPDRATIPLTLYQFATSTEFTLRWNLVFAQVILTNLPLLIMYVLFQRRVMSGLTDGALTG